MIMATIRKQKGVIEKDENEVVVMSMRNILTYIESDGLYEYPEMNSKLYLHFKGFKSIANLDLFVNLKTLYLENNMISVITGLSSLK